MQSLALDCRLVEKFSDPQFAQNTQFWDELGKISEQSDEAIAALIKKHDPSFKFTSSSVAPPSTFKIPQIFSLSKKSEKALKTLSPNQRKNFDEFLSIVNSKEGPQGLYKNPGKWHFEKLKGAEYGGASTIRLDSGVRVLFKSNGDGFDILDIGNHIGH